MTLIRSMAPATAAILAWTLLAGAAPPARAQEEDVQRTAIEQVVQNATADQMEQKPQELMSTLAGHLADMRRFNTALPTAAPEDSLVLRLRQEQTQDAIVKVVRALAAVVASAPTSPEAEVLHADVRAVFQELTPHAWALIADLRAEVDDLRRRRLDTPPAERSRLEDTIRHVTGRLDMIFEFTVNHAVRLDAMGLDGTEVRDNVRRLLLERADDLDGRLALAAERVREDGVRLKESPADADVALLQVADRKSLDTEASSLAHTLDLLEKLGVRDADLRAKLVTATQDLAAGIRDARVTVTVLRRMWSNVLVWLNRETPRFLVKIVLTGLILLAGWLLARAVRAMVRRSVERPRMGLSQLLRRTLVSFAYNSVMIIALMIALAQFGISVGPMLAGLGVVGFILGFAMQDSLSNFAAGMMILFYRPYDVGDLIEVGGVFGNVRHQSMVATEILTLDNQKLVVPNSKIWGDVIKNVTDQHVRRVDMTFGISYQDDIPHAEKVLESILADNPKVLHEPAPVVRVHNLGDSSVDFVVRPWVRTQDYWEVYWEVTREVKMRFDAEGVSIPFPQRDVHLYPAPKEGEAEA